MSLKNIRVVLVRPIYSGNAGSVCRAMKNMGLSDLVIAGPHGEWDLNQVWMMATHAQAIFENRKEYATIAEAVADCALVAGTTARQGLYRAHSQTPREWAPRLLQAAKTGCVALMFGPEDDGLTNEDLAYCTQIIRIPSSTDHSSLNLAQAVLLCAYEIFQASGSVEVPRELSREASSAMREKMFELWREALLGIGFMKGDKADHMMMGLRRILSRGPLTEKDVRIMVGIARQVRWAGRQIKRKPE
jgi:tRNA/rRNA methyltransferase